MDATATGQSLSRHSVSTIVALSALTMLWCPVGSAQAQPPIHEFPIAPNRQAAAIVAGADGQLWFTEPDSNRIGRMTVSLRSISFTKN